jgi:hypothetical protein
LYGHAATLLGHRVFLLCGFCRVCLDVRRFAPFAASAIRQGDFPHEAEGFIDHNGAKDNEK